MVNSQQEVAAITVTQCQRNGDFAIFTTWNTLQWTALSRYGGKWYLLFGVEVNTIV
ncbi:uncharacterized protein CPUR_07776 [Claviceps purpurea 20.1]|uniref:Uncharacterized protein n=1 Tax=Claviceps purpurea (strain 20.1) TaxID=1111077 RepID=M1WFP6_CLAP2|nr:uncharacterized protein CPUR_07776 [Claviceps purpurea 20.1]